MKRKPEKNYNCPKYAAGLAAMLLAGGMTGCTETAGDVQIDGGMDVQEGTTEYVELAGDVAPEETCIPTEPFETEPATEVAFEGDIAIPEDTTEVVELAGDIEMPEETCAVEEKVAVPGMVIIPTEETTEAEEPVLAGDVVME